MFDSLKKWVVEQVLWVETNMKGKSGKEKRQAVVDKIDSIIPLPWFLEWMDGPLIGWLVDKVCELMNGKNGHNWDAVSDAKETVETVAKELPNVDAYTREATEVMADAVAKATATATAVASDAVKNTVTTAVSKVIDTGDKLSEHFSRKEFACKCGCGKADVDKTLVEKLEKFRKLCGDKPIHINSACRCEKHNKTVGGSAKSQHLYGKAADVRKILGMTIDQMAKLAEQAGFTGIGKYNSFLHVDVRPTPTKWDYRK